MDNRTYVKEGADKLIPFVCPLLTYARLWEIKTECMISHSSRVGDTPVQAGFKSCLWGRGIFFRVREANLTECMNLAPPLRLPDELAH